MPKLRLMVGGPRNSAAPGTKHPIQPSCLAWVFRLRLPMFAHSLLYVPRVHRQVLVSSLCGFIHGSSGLAARNPTALSHGSSCAIVDYIQIFDTTLLATTK